MNNVLKCQSEILSPTIGKLRVRSGSDLFYIFLTRSFFLSFLFFPAGRLSMSTWLNSCKNEKTSCPSCFNLKVLIAAATISWDMNNVSHVYAYTEGLVVITLCVKQCFNKCATTT
ncbi:hypothetical protein OIU77_022096 [Salix suchowensis]|uniref:Uncharacterized protein n=1 Tax=Salix suchowensis TaxID=1278906 RepID=A0ABQ9CFY2_9ROSI|nr:hypothetical protein OIU77_022096 [Salix suchowensis]